MERIVNRICNSNTYVISQDGSKDIWLVDVGDIGSVLNDMPSGSQVKGVFLTHTHFDHLYGINQLYERFPEITVYVAETGIEALYSAKKNLSKYHESPIEYEGTNVVRLHDGDEIVLFASIVLKAIATPGHTPDSMVFKVGEYLFTGDAYIPGVKVVSKLPGGDKGQALASRIMILELAKGLTVCPGHGETDNEQ